MGWKEDFNMAFMSPIPTQVAALRYLEKAGICGKEELSWEAIPRGEMWQCMQEWSAGRIFRNGFLK